MKKTVLTTGDPQRSKSALVFFGAAALILHISLLGIGPLLMEMFREKPDFTPPKTVRLLPPPQSK
ncbi:MAG: hypothetical protein ACQEQV_07875, partial [Fibrobacterota bacterium]